MKKFTILFIMLVFATLSMEAQKFSYNGNWGKSGFNLIDSRSNAVQVIYSVSEFNLEDVLVDGQIMKILGLKRRLARRSAKKAFPPSVL